MIGKNLPKVGGFIFLPDIYCNQQVCVTPRSFSSLSLGKIRDMYVHRRRLKFSSAKHSSCKSWAHTPESGRSSQKQTILLEVLEVVGSKIIVIRPGSD